MIRLKNFSKSQSGDTIIEVLASIAIVGVALAGGYALSSHSLQTGLDASQRSAALAIAEGQVEFLKNSVVNDTTSAYTNAPQPFCINDTNGAVMSGSVCQSHFGIYRIDITYESDSASPRYGVFTIVPNWQSYGGNGNAELDLYYKLPNPQI